MVTLPGGNAGIGFDDLGFSASLDRVLVPAGRTGTLDLIDPRTLRTTTISGFTRTMGSTAAFTGGHGEGITSVDQGNAFLFVTDRSSRSLDVVEPKTRSVISSTRLAAAPDYVRFIAETGEVWVTEPSAEKIEVFGLKGSQAPRPIHSGFILLPDGPESLILDSAHARAFTNLWHGVTVAIDLRGRSIAARWRNGCAGSRGLALDQTRALLFAACDEGTLSVLNLNTGKPLGRARSGRGVDIIAYNQKLAHVYMPGAESATMAIIGISPTGSATVLKTIETVKGAHCATADNRGQIFVCDPADGKILVFKDSVRD